MNSNQIKFIEQQQRAWQVAKTYKNDTNNRRYTNTVHNKY